MYWLSLLIANGVFGALGTVFLDRQGQLFPRYFSLINTLVSIAIFILLIQGFDPLYPGMQLIEEATWIPALNIQYHLGVDGISLVLIGLTLFITLLITCSSWVLKYEQVNLYLGLFLLMQSMIIGVFCALDGILFYFFWEGMLLPMYLCIGIWGAKDRSFASMKFFLYTFLGSVLMLLGFIYLGIKAGSFSLSAWEVLPLTSFEQRCLFLAFLSAFAVKIPMFPVHTWLPDAHTEAPAMGSVILAALMLKVGAYGLVRFSLPILPDASLYFSNMMIVLSLIAIIYVGIVAYSQSDMKRLIAYSSVAHMGFVTLGLFMVYKAQGISGAKTGYSGAMIQMVSHAFGSGALFLAFGLLYQQAKERCISHFGGLGVKMPVFSACFMVFVLSTIGVPGTAGFVGEWLVILSALSANIWIGMLSALTLVISAAYLLSMYRQAFFGKPSQLVSGLSDITLAESALLSVLVIMIIVLGCYPAILLDIMNPAVGRLVDVSLMSKVV